MARLRISSILNPQGALPPSAYWWRRLSIGLVILAVIVLAVVLSRLGNNSSSSPSAAAVITSSTPTPSSTPSVSTTPSGSVAPSVSPSPTATVSAPCEPSALKLVVTTTAKTYPTGTPVVFTATVSTTGGACVISGGLQIVVASGDDRIWSNTDCAPASTGTDALKAAGSVAAQRTWDRLRTKPACAAVNGPKTTTAGTYRAVATWGGVTSEPAVFSLT